MACCFNRTRNVNGGVSDGDDNGNKRRKPKRSALETELKIFQDTNDKLRKELFGLYGRQEDSNQKLKEALLTIQKLQNDNTTLTNELRETRENLNHMIASRSRYKKRYEKYRGNTHLLRDHVKDLRRVIEKHDQINISDLKLPNVIDDPDCESMSAIEN